DGADGGDDTALVVVRAHAPHPPVLELRAVGIDRPPAHLHPGVHVPVQHETRPAAGAGEAADRLPRLLAWLGGVGHLEHLDLQADVRHVVGEVVRDPLLLDGGAGNADGRLRLGGRYKMGGQAMLARLREHAPISHSIHYADLSRLVEMKRVAAEIAAAETRIDVLINNAGALFGSRQVTEDGLERTFAVN